MREKIFRNSLLPNGGGGGGSAKAMKKQTALLKIKPKYNSETIQNQSRSPKRGGGPKGGFGKIPIFYGIFFTTFSFLSRFLSFLVSFDISVLRTWLVKAAIKTEVLPVTGG